MRTLITRAAALGAGAALALAGVGMAVGGVAAAAPTGLHPASAATAPTVDTTVDSTPDSAPAADPTTTTAPVVAASSSVTLPLFGVPLTVGIDTGPSGALSSVAVNPADGWTAVQDRPNKVTFVNDEGTAKVRVTARHGGESVSAKGTTLADISGAGGWSGDVFGTGTATTVGFTVGTATDGGPDITGVTSSDPAAVVGATQHHGGRGGKGGSFARASVTFTAAGQQRVLWISAVVSSFDEHDQAAVSVTLSGTRGVPQAAADAAGAKTWSGLLCDGTAATIAYTVGSDGSLSAVSATPTTATVTVDGDHAAVRFTTSEQVGIFVRSHDDQLEVQIAKRFRCETTDPTVNTPTSTTVDDHAGDHSGDHGAGAGGGDHGAGAVGGDHGAGDHGAGDHGAGDPGRGGRGDNSGSGSGSGSGRGGKGGSGGNGDG